jgi:uncharacterized DUF497 family protein
MSKLSFEWDSLKAATNAAKHGITFLEAQTVFYDEDAPVIPDPDHSQDEDGFIIMARVSNHRCSLWFTAFGNQAPRFGLFQRDALEQRNKKHIGRSKNEKRI